MFLANPSKIASAQVMAIAAHKLRSTLALGLLSALQKHTVTAMVIKTASNEMEQPTIEMISSALVVWKKKITCQD